MMISPDGFTLGWGQSGEKMPLQVTDWKLRKAANSVSAQKVLLLVSQN
jgi:hypothetical protein